MAAPGRAAGRLMRVLRSPLLVPGGWVVGIGSAAALVFMPPVAGVPGLVVGALSFVLAVVLVVSVVVVAVALAAPLPRRAAAWLSAVASVRVAHTRERSS